MNSQFDNNNLSGSNSLTHLLDFNDEFSELLESIQVSYYYSEDEAVLKCTETLNSCSILSLNCQSLNSKFDYIKLLLNKFHEQNSTIQIICLQETWFKNSQKMDVSIYNIDGYNLLSFDCHASAHGGLAIYIHKNWNYKIINSMLFPHWENVHVEISSSKDPLTKFTVYNVYRPPHNHVNELTSFIDSFNEILLNFQNSNTTAYICGDFNIDLLKIQSDIHSNDFLESIFTNGFLPSMTLPTRLSNTSSLIDNILYSNQNKFNFSCILESSISDHQPVLINTFHSMPRTKISYITIYNNNNKSKDNFIRSIQNENIYDKFEKDLNNDPNKNYEILENTLVKNIQKHLGEKTVKLNKKIHKIEPWMTNSILKSVNQKNKLYKKMKKTKTTSPSYEQKKNAFNSFRNTLRKVISAAKRNYYGYQFRKNKSDIKKTWQTLNNVLHRKKETTTPDCLLINNQECDDKQTIANTFNNYFATVCSNNRPTSTISFDTYLKNPTNESFGFKLIDNDTILKIISRLKISKCCGHDSISNSIIKMIPIELSKCLALIINQTLTTGIYPTRLKIAKIIPIYKKESKLNCQNYRPISILPSLSKIFEYVMHEQLLNYFTTYNLFTDQQYGFRPNRSTELAAIELMDHNIGLMKSGQTPLNIYIDLSKAFDCLNHSILLRKLAHYGLDQSAIKLLESYLKNRTQYVSLDSETRSNLHNILFGIPQGSVMGPLLFNIYINDLVDISNKFKLIQYADDTTLLAPLESFGDIKNPDNLAFCINAELENISKWLQSNELLLNSSKSKYMLYFKPPKKIPQLNIQMNDETIEQVNSFNFLGIHLDQNVTWKVHTTSISTKISRVVGILRKMQKLFPPHILITIYNALVHSYLNYGLLLWGNNNIKILALQKKAIRVISFKPYISHTTPLFKKLNILNLNDLYKLHLYKLFFKLKNNLLPPYFNDFKPTYNSDIQTRYNLRRNSVRLPMPNKEYFVQSPKYQFLKLVETMPIEDQNRADWPSLSEFTRHIKSSLITRYDPICHIRDCYVCQNE